MYYETKLYPLQDKVLDLIAQTQTEFYLTSGTALNRYYLFHRYSDDLDFFINNSDKFQSQVDICEELLKSQFGDKFSKGIKFDSFSRFFVEQHDAVLKIEFVNDVGFRVGNPTETSLFARTDSWENILSNKICALSRNAPKDVSDIWLLAKKFSFNWKIAIVNTQNKGTWVDETEVHKTLSEFDLSRLADVNWIHPFDLNQAKHDFEILLKDLFFGLDNSLVAR